MIALGPLTNIALLVHTHPEVLGNVERIVMMGGSAGVGNASPVAEFNTWHDPEATAIVLNAGAPVTMYGLDVFYQVTVGAADVAMLATHENDGARLAGMLCRHQIAICGHDPRLAGDALIGDAGAVCAVADPAGLVVERLAVQVELAPGLSRGQTLVDRRPLPGEVEVHGLVEAAPRHDVALGVDGARYRSLFLETVTVTTEAGCSRIPRPCPGWCARLPGVRRRSVRAGLRGEAAAGPARSATRPRRGRAPRPCRSGLPASAAAGPG